MLLSFRQINQLSLNFDGLCVCKQLKGCLQKSLFYAVNKIQVKKKRFNRPTLQDSYQDWLVLFNMQMYDEFHVQDVLIVLLYM